MAAVRNLRVSLKPESGSDRSESDSDSDSDKDVCEPEPEPEPMEVEEGELGQEDIPIRRSLKELLPDTSRRYENKAGTFITGIDVTSKEAVEKKEKRARRFHFRAEGNLAQRNVVLDIEILRKAIPKIRLEALHVCGVDDMSTQDIFGFFKEYPPAHIEWIDDTSCNVVWLDDVTSSRALINISCMPDPSVPTSETDGAKETDPPAPQRPARRADQGSEDEEEEDEDEEDGEVVDAEVGSKAEKSSEESEGKASESEDEGEKKTAPENSELGSLSVAEKESLFRNDLRTTIKEFKGRNLFLRFATHDDKKELGAARRSRYYMKYGNPNYGGMKGILSNSWKRRFHTRRIQRDVLKTKKPLIGDSMGHTPPYKHRHSDLVNLPEEPIEEEEEEEEEEEGEDMDSEDRVVEYREEREKGDRDRERDRVQDRERHKERYGGLRSAGSLRSSAGSLRRHGSTSASSDSDEMDYDLELKMISTPSPKKSKKMTMYADEVESNLKTLRNSVRGEGGSSSGVRNRIGGGAGGGGGTKAPAVEKVTDVRQLLEEKRQGLAQQQRSPQPYMNTTARTDVRKRLGKRPHSPESRRSTSPVAPRAPPPRREPLTDVHSRLGVPKQESRAPPPQAPKEKKTGGLWSRLGSSQMDKVPERKAESKAEGGARGSKAGPEEDDSELQKVWGAMIKEKEQQSHKLKKSRLDNLPSLQIEISRDSSNGSDSDS